eukprot:gb/GECH01014052.1/.p1 GENE.gb/GECH01014052.1/~~gb/GECH01014052.1/.p1  ORF type:complete len:361 (+),score=51.61 gb/GECH01014052.1/:1-1083(+)
MRLVNQTSKLHFRHQQQPKLQQQFSQLNKQKTNPSFKYVRQYTSEADSTTPSQKPVVVLFGGSGFVGSHLMHKLAPQCSEVRIASRTPDNVNSRIQKTLDSDPNSPLQVVKAEYADALDSNAVAHTIEGADAVINLSGIMYESFNTFEQIHITGARNIAHAARVADVPTLLHMSGLGMRTTEYSRFSESKMRGEDVTYGSFPEVTILRPGIMYGPGDHLLSKILWYTNFTPIVPIPCGSTPIQPAYIEDVTDAMMRVLESPQEFQSQEYDLGGPQLSLADFVDQACSAAGKGRVILPLPRIAAKLSSHVTQYLPNPSLTIDTLPVLTEGVTVPEGALTFEDMGITPRHPRDALAEYLGKK